MHNVKCEQKYPKDPVRKILDFIIPMTHCIQASHVYILTFAGSLFLTCSSLSYCSTFSQFWHFVIKKDLHFLIHPSVAWYQMSQAKRMKRYLEINLQHFTSHKWVHCNTHDRFWVETIYYINRILKKFHCSWKRVSEKGENFGIMIKYAC